MDRPRNLAKALESVLWIVTLSCLGVVAFAVIDGGVARHAADAYAQQSAATDHAKPVDSGKLWAAASEGDVVGRVVIPAIGLSVPITVGIETNSLIRGVGHIRGTAMPGGLGTVGLAGHRDTYFRPLRHIAQGMDVQVTDGSGTYHYEVDTTEIVTPEQVDVLAIRDRPELTLVTCYPFDFVGQAPKRFIVHAHLISLEPDTNGARPAHGPAIP